MSETQEISIGKEQITEAYVAYFERHGHKPGSMLTFCRDSNLTEGQVYPIFSSLDRIEQACWEQLFEEVVQKLHEDETFRQYSVREKTLAFFFTFFQDALPHRSFVLATAGSLREPKLLQWKHFRHGFREFFRSLAEEAVERDELPSRFNMQRFYAEGAWVQFLFLINFWIKDDSEAFASTDEAIERSVNLIFDLGANRTLDQGLDFARFLLRNYRQS